MLRDDAGGEDGDVEEGAEEDDEASGATVIDPDSDGVANAASAFPFDEIVEAPDSNEFTSGFVDAAVVATPSAPLFE